MISYLAMIYIIYDIIYNFLSLSRTAWSYSSPTPIIQIQFNPSTSRPILDDRRIGHASSDTQRDRGNSSRLYEVNIRMWRYGRGRPRMVSIAEAEKIRAERLSESRIRAAETRKRSSEAAAAAGAADGSVVADWTLAYDIILCIIVNIVYDIISML